jgi:hypothetical protein
MLESSQVAAQLAVSQEGLSSTKSVSYFLHCFLPFSFPIHFICHLIIILSLSFLSFLYGNKFTYISLTSISYRGKTVGMSAILPRPVSLFQRFPPSSVWVSWSGGYEDFYILGYNANVSKKHVVPSSGLKNKPNNKPWRWRWHVPPKPRLNFNGLHGIIHQQIELFVDLHIPILCERMVTHTNTYTSLPTQNFVQLSCWYYPCGLKKRCTKPCILK